MELILSILIWFLNRLWASVLLIIIVAVLLGIYQERAIRRKPHDPKIPASVVALSVIPVFILSFFSRYLTIPLIHVFGEETVGRVVSVESIPEMYNEQQVYRHDVIFNHENGELIETSFKTSDFNVYPITNSVSYPSSGSNFTLRYMKHIPSEFIIVKDKNEEQLSDLNAERSTLQEKLSFDPDNEEFQSQLNEIEKEIQGFEEHTEVEGAEQELLEVPAEVFISEILEVETLAYNPTHDKIITAVTFESNYGDNEDAVISVSLSTQTVDHIYLIDAFENFVGVAQEHFYTYNWSDDQLFAFDVDSFQPTNLEESLPVLEDEPLLVGDYLFDFDVARPINSVIHLGTNEKQELNKDAIQHIINHGDWYLFTNDFQNEKIQTILSMTTLADYKAYFQEVLADPVRSFEHSQANSGIFFSENKNEISAMIYMLTDDIISHSGTQSDFKNQSPSSIEVEIIGIEDNGTVYGLGLEDDKLVGLKRNGSEEVTQITIDSPPINHLDFTSIHLEDRILILHGEGLFQISTADLSVLELFKFADII